MYKQRRILIEHGVVRIQAVKTEARINRHSLYVKQEIGYCSKARLP